MRNPKMKYKQRLIAAAKTILAGDSNADDPPVNFSDIGITVTLKPHQVEGVSWLIRRYILGVNVILGDEMGLGKTLQALVFLSYLKAFQKNPGPFLVLCPLSVTDGWVSETASFAPCLTLLTYVGDKEHRRSLRRYIHEHVKEQGDVQSLPFDILLTTYDIAMMDQDFLSQIPWYYAIIDEAQRLKNFSSVLYNVLREHFVMPRRLLMTGTPIQNNLSELWALMHFCMPAIFGTREQFLSTFKEAGDTSPGHDAEKVKEQFKILKYILRALMLRRTKSMLMKSGSLVLPPLTEITLMAPLVVLQKKVYVSILRKELPRLLALSSGTPSPSLQNIVIQLRKACSHPYLFPGIEPEPYAEGEHLVQASGKLLILDQLLHKLHESGHRVLLFAQMTHTLDILQDFLELRRYSYERLDGSIRAEERFAAIRSFSRQAAKGGPDAKAKAEASNSDAFVFMISTRAGGVGLNLVAADTVIFYEQDWNPQVDRQALQRAHRIGQMNHVLSINLVTARTIEEVIMRRAERKFQLSHNVVGEDVTDYDGKQNTGGEVGDLRAVILGLHMFDLTEISEENSDQPSKIEMDAAVEKVLAFRDGQRSNDDRKQEINPRGISDGHDLVPSSVTYDPGLDEASYLSWVQKFNNESQAINDHATELENRRKLPEEKHLKAEAARKKAEETKLAKWEALGYRSLAVKDHVSHAALDITPDTGTVNFVYGDCTQPSKVCPSEPTIIFSCVDDSGNWGRGGLFDALAKLSESIPKAYERASEFDDLHLGDLHLLEITESIVTESNNCTTPQWVALAVVQSYSPRRKIPRSNISMSELEQCLSKASSTAAQNSASIHMPRIGYQDGSDRSEWYAVERILRKYAAMYGVKIYVYYYKHSASG